MKQFISNKIQQNQIAFLTALPVSVMWFDADLRCIGYNRDDVPNFSGLEADQLANVRLFDSEIENEILVQVAPLFRKAQEQKNEVKLILLSNTAPQGYCQIAVQPISTPNSETEQFMLTTLPLGNTETNAGGRSNTPSAQAELVFNANGLVLNANPLARQLLGFIPDDFTQFIGKYTWQNMQQEDKIALHEHPLAMALSLKQTENAILKVRKTEGGALHIWQLNMRKRSTADGVVLEIVPQPAIAKAWSVLGQKLEKQDSFSRAVAHDLRTPVANLKNLFALIERVDDPAKKELLLDKAKISSQRLEELLQGLLDLADQKSNKNKAEGEKLHLEKELEFVLLGMGKGLKSDAHTIVTDFQIPQIEYPKAQLRSILLNMLTNAFKYSKADTHLLLKITCKAEDKFTLLSFKDNGIGIDLERNGKNLFEPFKRFTAQAEGKGIGLSLVRNFVQKNGGHIAVESQLDQGTEFKLYLKPLPQKGEQISLF